MSDEVIIKLDQDLANEISSILCEEAALSSTARALFSATLPQTVWRKQEGILKRLLSTSYGANLVEFVRPELSERFSEYWFHLVFDKARRIHARNRKFWAKVYERHKDVYDPNYSWGLQCQGKFVFISRGRLLSELAKKASEETK